MRTTDKQVLAFDYGASSGRAMLGKFDGSIIRLEELHRFPNDPVTVNGTLYWDILRLFHEMKQGLLAAKHAGGFESVGVDTWGVDFALLDHAGNLLENPVHYRDRRTAGVREEMLQSISPEALYQTTGNQMMEFNTLFQLGAVQKYRPELLGCADTLLLMPDLFNYLLCGEKCAELSIASTTQLLDLNKGDWARDLCQSIGIPEKLLPPIVSYGSKVGVTSDVLCQELGISPRPVIAVAAHDTQSALVSIPTEQKDFIFISCGTWSLFGTEIANPVLSPEAMRAELTNECGYGGNISLMKNIIGLWLVQESRRQWAKEGQTYSFAELDQLAEEAPAFQFFIDPNAPEFVPAGNLPERIREYCIRTGQTAPKSPGEIVRCIYESLAFTYQNAMKQITAFTGIRYPAIHMIGGGSKSSLFCQMTADACGCPVITGPAEATVLGNIAVQLIALGELPDLASARTVIRNSFPVDEFAPKEQELWKTARNNFQKVTTC